MELIHPSPGIDHPVTFLRYEQLTDGTSRKVVVYENQKLDKRAKPIRVLCHMVLDLRTPAIHY